MALERRRVSRPPRPDYAVSPWPFAGMVLMAAAFFLYAASGVVAPWWAVVVLLGVWIALFVLCCRWWSRHPKRLVPIAVGAMMLWFVVLVLGGAVLDWG